MEWLIALAAFIHIIVCPFTKVEESFNLQATHDLLYHGSNISQYDHLEFPGVVPRTFLGPLILAFVSYPGISLIQLLNITKFLAQFVVRGSLALLVLLAFYKFRVSIQRQFGTVTATWLLLITASQFHMVYYMSRTLPNTFALVLALLAYHYWIEQDHKCLIITAAAVSIIFRAETAVLMGIIVLIELFSRRLSLWTLVKYAVPVAIFMISLTCIVDSFFWQRPLWPEGEVLWFNLILNKSGDYGTSPFAWYFYSAIPRALSSSVFLVPLGIYADRRVALLLIPPLSFTFLYSFLPHKELRFILYVFPLLNVSAARACTFIWHGRLKSYAAMCLTLLMCLHLVINVGTTSLLLYVSYNYPGGWALARLHQHEGHKTGIHVHMDDYTAQTGASRFIEVNPYWRYSKAENLAPGSAEIMTYTHLILEGRTAFSSSVQPYKETHTIIDTIPAFSHFKLDYTTFPPVVIRTKPKILILQRKHNNLRVVIVNNTAPTS